MVKYTKSSFLKLGMGVFLNFNISQHSRDSELMNSLINYLDCGRITNKKDKEAVIFEVNKFSDLNEKIIPFFKKYSIEGYKKANFCDFCKIALLMQDKRHLTSEGLEQIINIKNGMNTGRK
jgi:hypothetical protein